MRKVCWIVAFLTAIVFVKFFAQEYCKETEAMTIGLTNQGGFSFFYQSGKGKNCRFYRLKNKPGFVLTPVIWKDEQEIFMQLNLPEYPNDTTSKWLEAIKISSQPTMIDLTTLSYGLNMDEYKESIVAYRKGPARPVDLQPFITIIRGVVVDFERKLLRIGIQVASYVEGKNPYNLFYSISILDEIEYMPFQLLRPGVPSKDLSTLGLIWEAAASQPFFEHLDKKEIIGFTTEYPKIVVEITANEIEVEESKLLVLVQGTKCLVATTAPAYRPKN